MEKTAKITRTIFKNEYSGQHGKIYYHDIELDNGDKGQVGTKEREPEKINPGKTITYTIEESQHGTKIKILQSAGRASLGGGSRGGNSSFALAYAKDVVIASWSEHAPKKLASDDLFLIAEKMYKWMEERK